MLRNLCEMIADDVMCSIRLIDGIKYVANIVIFLLFTFILLGIILNVSIF